MERKAVLRIYTFIIGLIIIDPLLSSIITVTTVLRLLELSCLFMIVFYVKRLYSHKCLIKYSGYAKFLMLALLAISFGAVVRGDVPAGIKGFFLTILSHKGILLYMLPFIILSLPNRKYFNDILHVFYKAALFSIPLWLLNLNSLVQVGTYKGEDIGAYLPFFSAFLLGMYSYFNSRQRKITIIIWAVFFMLMLLNARRNVSFSMALYALIAYVFSILHNIKRNPLKYFIILAFSVLALLILQLNMDRLTSGTFQNIANRASEDSRSGVELLFFADFNKSPVTDWIFGRGMDGGYFQLETNEETGETTDNRKVIETGYLNMMLKGGIVYVSVILLIMLLALSKAFGNNRDVIIKYMGVILLTYFIDLYTTNPVYDFSVRSIVFWFIISVLLQNSKQQYITNKYKTKLII